jgi:hypothetical protein
MAIDTKKLIKYIKKLVDAESKKIQADINKRIAMEVKKTLHEQKLPHIQNSQPVQQNVKPKKFTANPILNEMLNETAQEGKWRTIGADASTPPSVYMNGVVNNQSINEDIVDEEINVYEEDEEFQSDVPSIDEVFQMKKSLLPNNIPAKKQSMQKNNGNIPDFLKSKLE